LHWVVNVEGNGWRWKTRDVRSTSVVSNLSFANVEPTSNFSFLPLLSSLSRLRQVWRVFLSARGVCFSSLESARPCREFCGPDSGTANLRRICLHLSSCARVNFIYTRSQLRATSLSISSLNQSFWFQSTTPRATTQLLSK